jgi:hypothetical protein
VSPILAIPKHRFIDARKLRHICFCRPYAGATASTGSHLAPRVQNRKRHAIADAARFAPPWKWAESNGHVIGLVISFAVTML